MNPSLPDLVADATARATSAGFAYACQPAVGRLLAVLAAQVPRSGHILEIGTGIGVGTAWLLTGLGSRTDVIVTTVEQDSDRMRLAGSAGWPDFVDARTGDIRTMYAALGTFDLIFADAEGGKHDGLDATIAALNPRGVLVVDDMAPQPHWPADFAERQQQVRRALFGSPDLIAVELTHGSGVIVATKLTYEQ